MTRGKLFFASRPFIRLVVGRWSVQAPPPEGPTVFVCSHGDMAGPLATQCWLPFPTRPWVLHVFLSREECRRQYRDYTFTQRFGLPRPAAALLAWAVSGYASALVRSVGAIPVYRGSARLKETFRRTVEALQAGDPVIVFPDVDYTDRSGDMGEIYDGFLLIDRFWQRVSDTPLDFVPLRLDRKVRRIAAGEAVRFDRTAPRQGETVRVREALLRGLNGEI
jgi:hypothetical protein